jgi:hypothetical protein
MIIIFGFWQRYVATGGANQEKEINTMKKFANNNHNISMITDFALYLQHTTTI